MVTLKIQKYYPLIMTVDDKIRDEKIQHINKEAAKTLILLLGTID